MPDSDKVARRRFHCNLCATVTWHQLLWDRNKTYDGEDYEEWTIEFLHRDLEVWECLGCEEALFLERLSTSEDPEPEERHYPERTARRIKPKTYQGMSLFLGYAYEESIRAFNSDCPILVAAGLRALLEGICNDKRLTSDRSNLETKIDSLKQVVSASVVNNLHGLRFLGNQALHELTVPDWKDLTLAMQVMEHVMTAIYELDHTSGRLFQQLQERKRNASWELEEDGTP